MGSVKQQKLREEILRLTAEYYKKTWGEEPPFVPGEDPVRYGGRVFDKKELCSLEKIYQIMKELENAGFVLKNIFDINYGSDMSLAQIDAVYVKEADA